MQKLSRSLLAISALVGLAACGDDVVVPPAQQPPAPTVTGVTVSPQSVNILVGEKVVFSAALQTTGTVTNTAVTWSSANSAIASVSATGEVTGVAAGTTTIRAASQANPSATGSGSVTVRAASVQSVSVAPNAASVQVGGTVQAVATVNRDAGVAGTVNWASSAASIASVNASGLVTGVAPGTAVITATSTADATKSASLSVTVTAVPNSLLSLTVSPSVVNIGPGGTQQLTPTVNTVGSPAVTYSYTSSNAAVATVTSGGLVTGVANGTATVTVTATTSTNSISAAVQVNVQAASVSIQSLTTCVGGPPCAVVPVNLAATAGQIEATLNINSGSQQIDSVVVRIDGTHAASQVFGVNGAPNAPVTLSINTARFDANYVPSWQNGPRTIRAEIYPRGATSPTASNTVQFTLANPDVVYFNPTGLSHLGNSAVSSSGATWWKGGFTYTAFPVNYSGAIASITYNSTACGAATGTGAPFTATFTCAAVQSAQNITNVITVSYGASGYTLTAPPTAMMTAATAGYVPGKPVFAVVSTNEDNVGPTTSAVSFSNGLTAVGSDMWAGSPTTWSATATDGGVGVAGQSIVTPNPPHTTDVSNNGGSTWSFVGQSSPTNPVTLAETLTGSGYIASGAPATDLLGNVGSRGPSSASFGVDLVVLDAQYADRATSALATIFPLTANATIYAEAAPTAGNPSWTATRDGATEVVAVDAIDTRSGLDNPNAQISSMSRRTATGTTSCASGASSMTTILTDNYVQTTTPAQLDCGLAAGSRVGYYKWTASVKDRAQNTKVITTDGTTRLDSIYIAIDEAAPNITGLGFQTSLYTGGQPANYGISANDDLELKDGQVALTYGGMTPTVTYPFGSAAYSSAAFGAAFDTPIVNVINGANLTLGYYVVRWDFVTAAAFVPGAAPSGNVAGFTSSGINSGVTASVRDVANQATAHPTQPVLATQIQDRSGAPAYGSSMIHFDITGNAAGVVTVRHVGPTSTTVPFCDRIEIFQGVGGAAGGDPSALAGTLTYRATISAGPVITDNGFQRFWTYSSPAISPAIPAGEAVAVCFKAGSAIMSRFF